MGSEMCIRDSVVGVRSSRGWPGADVFPRFASAPSCGTRCARVRPRLLGGPGKSERRGSRRSDFPGLAARLEEARAGQVPQDGRMRRAAPACRCTSSCAIGRRRKRLRYDWRCKWSRRRALLPSSAFPLPSCTSLTIPRSPCVSGATVSSQVDALSARAARQSCPRTRVDVCSAAGQCTSCGAARRAEPRRSLWCSRGRCDAWIGSWPSWSSPSMPITQPIRTAPLPRLGRPRDRFRTLYAFMRGR